MDHVLDLPLTMAVHVLIFRILIPTRLGTFVKLTRHDASAW